MGSSSLSRLTDAEFQIMEVVWEEGGATVNQVWETINRARHAPLSRTTILVQMNRLEEKKWLKHRERGRAFIYYPTRQRDETLEALLGDVHRRFFNNSSSDLLRCLFRSIRISKEEIKRLKEIIRSKEGEPK